MQPACHKDASWGTTTRCWTPLLLPKSPSTFPLSSLHLYFITSFFPPPKPPTVGSFHSLSSTTRVSISSLKSPLAVACKHQLKLAKGTAPARSKRFLKICFSVCKQSLWRSHVSEQNNRSWSVCMRVLVCSYLWGSLFGKCPMISYTVWQALQDIFYHTLQPRLGSFAAKEVSAGEEYKTSQLTLRC